MISLLQQSVELLASRVRVSPSGAKSLAHVCAVVPTAQSGRRLRRALAARFGALVPPLVKTTHGMLLDEEDPTLAGRTDEIIAFAEAIGEEEAKARGDEKAKARGEGDEKAKARGEGEDEAKARGEGEERNLSSLSAAQPVDEASRLVTKEDALLEMTRRDASSTSKCAHHTSPSPEHFASSSTEHFAFRLERARQLSDLRTILAPGALSFADVADFLKVDMPDEAERWRELADIEARFTAALAKRGKRDRIAAAKAFKPEFPGIEEIVRLDDLREMEAKCRLGEKAKARGDEKSKARGEGDEKAKARGEGDERNLSSLSAAQPVDEASRLVTKEDALLEMTRRDASSTSKCAHHSSTSTPNFDSSSPEHFASSSTSTLNFDCLMPRNAITPCATPADEANRIAEYFAAVKSDEALPALCVADPELFPEIETAFKAKGLKIHNPAATKLVTSSLGHLVAQIVALLRTQSYSVFSAFIRGGDVRRWLCRELKLTDEDMTAALVDLDNRQAEFLPEKIDDIAPKTEKTLRAIFEFVKVQLRKKGLRAILASIFRDFTLDESDPGAREFAAAAEAVNKLIGECLEGREKAKARGEGEDEAKARGEGEDEAKARGEGEDEAKARGEGEERNLSSLSDAQPVDEASRLVTKEGALLEMTRRDASSTSKSAHHTSPSPEHFASSSTSPEHFASSSTSTLNFDSFPFSTSASYALFEMRLEETSYELEPDEGEVILTDGWMELSFLEADELVIAGFREGCVPESTVGHPFLPDSLRHKLGLPDNASKEARDRAILRLAVGTRAEGAVRVFFHAIDAKGDVLKPSRLLFETDDDADLVARVRDFFSVKAGTAEGSPTDLPKNWKLALPIPPAYRELTKISPTRLDGYLRCPFTFYLRDKSILGDKRMDDRAEELASWEYGNLAHEALEAFGNDPLKDSTDADAIRAFLEEKVDAQLVDRFGTSIPAIVAMQGESVKRRLANFAAIQAERRAAGWRIMSVERKLEIEYLVEEAKARGEDDEKAKAKARGEERNFSALSAAQPVDEASRLVAKEDGLLEMTRRDASSTSKSAHRSSPSTLNFDSAKPHAVRLHGKCDRIDFNEATGEWCVIDYKTWDKADKAKSFEIKKDGSRVWKSLQLPIYCAMLDMDREEPFNAAKRDKISACYCVLGKTKDDVLFTEPMSGGYVPEAEAVVRENVAKIERGIFWPPAPSGEWQYDYKDWLMPNPESSVSEEWIADQEMRREAKARGEGEEEAKARGEGEERNFSALSAAQPVDEASRLVTKEDALLEMTRRDASSTNKSAHHTSPSPEHFAPSSPSTLDFDSSSSTEVGE